MSPLHAGWRWVLTGLTGYVVLDFTSYLAAIDTLTATAECAFAWTLILCVLFIHG